MPALLLRVVRAAAADAAWCESVCGFVRSRAIGPPAFAASAEGERAAAYAEFQGRVEDALEVLLDELDLVDQSEEFLMGLIGIDPEALALPPQQQAAAMHICSLDERAWFDRSMVLEAQAASS